MNLEEEIKEYIDDDLRLKVQSDGGEIKFISLDDDLLTVKLQGECSRCPVANGCFSDWFLSEIHKKFGDNIKIKKIIEIPYFWDL